jgi:hypothetical protein
MFDVWIRPHMPLPEERESGAIYFPQLYREDEQLTYLDVEVYVALIVAKQFKPEIVCDVDALLREIKTHPDKDEAIFDEYLQKTEKTLETITDEEFEALSKVPLTKQEIIESLEKLEKLGYIRKRTRHRTEATNWKKN